MILLKLYLFLSWSPWFPLVLAQNCPEKGISSHKILRNKRYRLSSLKRGNYTIQALISLTDDEQDARNKIACSRVTRAGLVRAYAMAYAIDRINNDANLLPHATLGLQIDNVCRSLSATMSRGMEIISQHRPNSVCRADFLKCDLNNKVSESDGKAAAGIVGTGFSFSSIPLASLMSLYQIPQISFSASSRLLSNNELYKSFFRTIPSDTKQIEVMLDIMSKFRWNYVFAVASDDDYGSLGISELKEKAKARNICITQDEYIPYGSIKTHAKVIEVVEKIKSNHTAKVVVLFCYVKSIGDLILKEANIRGVERIWLTSEIWNPRATEVLPQSIFNQTVGILTVSLKTYTMKYVSKYTEKQIKTNWHCDMWLQKFMDTRWNCLPTNITHDKMRLIGEGCSVCISTIMEELSVIPGDVYNLIDSVTALAHGIHNYIESLCPASSYTPCSVYKISPEQLTKHMYNVTFTNDEGRVISFNKHGDPTDTYYTVENIQYIDGKYRYVPVGNWSDRRSERLLIDRDNIQWPPWFSNTSVLKHPFSRCNPDCKHGERVINQMGCCWQCEKCRGNDYTNITNAMSCSSCGLYRHTRDHKGCELTETKWLTLADPPGMAIVSISAIGFLITTIASLILIKYWSLATIGDTSPHVTTLCCLLLFLSYGYGALHVIKPSLHLCSTMSAIFYLILMLYTAILMVQTRFWNQYLMEGVTKFLKGNLFRCQMISLLGYVLVEAASVAAWLVKEGEQVLTYKDNSPPAVFLLRRQCRVDTTAARYISTFIPIIILIITTFCAFRERNGPHHFHEPKFRSFSSIALCMIILAYMPTFQFVDGRYKSIVMAIATYAFGCTFLACLIFPKIYVGIMRYKHGAGRYPLNPGTEKKDEEEEEDSIFEYPSQLQDDMETAITEDMGESVSTCIDGIQEENIPQEEVVVSKEIQVITDYSNVNDRLERISEDANVHLDVDGRRVNDVQLSDQSI